MDLNRIAAKRKTGDEVVHADGAPIGVTLNDFWKWANSDLISNAQRGVLAEFLVACALGIDCGIRNEWDAFDLRSPDGTKVEVKSAGYIQAWQQKSLSKIRFDVSPKLSWDAATNTLAREPKRPADVYVFAIHCHREQSSIDPLNVRQWKFIVLPTSLLNERCGTQKSIGLASLQSMTSRVLKFEELRDAIRDAASNN